ncbi:MAG: LysR family transcriptional regulator [Zetaproteobacteria bacterium CG12_big_fil_rev_8_21_14_0_65_54_13]|nr:MAG: LysR family transcriptional regulator [Zetaproteobacteria bacterium CG12_big_fil_rev_8_21_14_0_65_54_13]PIX54017.1 MAG: LysR family transcriptional regulator [Zetaproteobacteria bacterium CG_4_10_14_3_um_filter_54_28]PJA28035.1 MAG: LysR family transcriptional regulator [Zetaproteobacteria bacterium CG_4_9_14_3_um_filter_54_145]
MNWDDLRLFLAVAREGSISGGARKLGVQHSTVSRRMRALEAKLGVRLIERKKSGYELTPAGERLKLAACKMEHQLLEVDGSLGGWDARLTGELRVSAINSMASGILMPMFARFSRRYPDIELHLLTSNENISLVERDADVAMRLTNTPTDTLICTLLGTVTSTVYGSRDYLAQLRSQGGKPAWPGVTCCGFHQSWTKKKSAGQRQTFFVDDPLLTTAALKQQMGVAYLPCFMGDCEPELERFCPPDPQMNLGLWLLFHPDLKQTARVLAFRDHMLDEMNAHMALFAGKLPVGKKAEASE